MKKRKHRIVGAEKGMVVMLVLILIITLSLLAAAANRNVVTDIAIASNHLGSVAGILCSGCRGSVRF